jgi:hypothetical protein
LKIHNLVHKSPLLEPVRSRMTLVHSIFLIFSVISLSHLRLLFLVFKPKFVHTSDGMYATCLIHRKYTATHTHTQTHKQMKMTHDTGRCSNLGRCLDSPLKWVTFPPKIPAHNYLATQHSSCDYCFSVHYPSSYFYLKHTQRFGDWILSPSSGGTYSVRPKRRGQNPVPETLFLNKKQGRWIMYRNNNFINRHKIFDLITHAVQKHSQTYIRV